MLSSVIVSVSFGMPGNSLPRGSQKVRVDGKERKLTKKELQEQMQLLEHKNVILMHLEEVKTFLKQKPEEWYLYADIMYAVESGIQKKYWKQVKSLFPGQK